ncbi:MAG: hypothetical protein NT169_23910 [Chloroflexi bacterium]|nr:hypothetical protein [Chloroflexota bacterium]
MGTSSPNIPAKKRPTRNLLTHDTVFWLLIGLSLIPIWITRYPPLQDYPDWLLQAQILRHLNDPALGFSTYYAALIVPVPNLGSIALIYLLSFVAPIEIAGKLALSCYAIALPLAVVYFLRATQARSTALEYLGLLLVYNYFFYMGYIGYLFGLALLMALIGYLWRRRFQPTGGAWLVLALGSVGLFLTHLMPWATLGFVCVSWAVLWRKQLGARRLLWLAAAFAPSLILLVFYVRMSAGQLVIVPYPPSSLLYNKIGSFIEPLILAPGFRPWPNVAPPLLLDAGLLAGVGAMVGVALRAARQQARAASVALIDSSSLLIAFGLAVMMAVLPFWFGGLVRPDERLTIPAALLTLAAVRWPRPTWRYDAALILIVIGMLVFHTATFVRGGDEMARLVNSLASFVGREEHPYFLRVPGACAQTPAEQWLPIIEPGPRAGFYLSAQRGGNNRQILDTGLVMAKNAIPFENRMLWPRLLSQLEAQLPDLQAEIFPEYSVIVLFGCPQPMERVAGQLSPAFTPVTSPEIPRSSYLFVLQRPDRPQP